MLTNPIFWRMLYQQSQTEVIATKAVEPIQLNHHLREYVHIDTSQESWSASPVSGVTRIMLERDGGEKTTRATSLVAYEANSQFTPHAHPKGEEFLVLAGTFSDEHGDYPAGSYVRNPPGSSHQPCSQEGCLIFVKLQQFEDDDNARIVSTLDANKLIDNINGWQQHILFDDYEQVMIYQTTKAKPLPNKLIQQGIEILVLSGSLVDNHQIKFVSGHWLRIPPSPLLSNETQFTATPNTQLFIKTKHLGDAI